MSDSLSLSAHGPVSLEGTGKADPFDMDGLQGAELILERQVSGRRLYFTEDGAEAFDAMLDHGFDFWPDRADGWLQTLVTSERRRDPAAEGVRPPEEFEARGVLFSTVVNVRAPTARANAAAVERQVTTMAASLSPLQVVTATRRRGDLVDVVALAASAQRRSPSSRN